MNRQILAFCAVAATAAIVCAGCGSHTAAPPPVQTASVPPPAAVPAPSSAPAAFQPYQLIPQPAPKPRVVVKKKCVLHVVKRGKTVYLTDQSGRSFLAGRDQQGRIYPVYQSPETHQDYPVYYDADRDRYYREAQADNGQYYRNYVGDPSDEYYESDSSQPYPNYQPEIVDTDGTDYDDSGGYYGNSVPGDGYPQHHHRHNDDWLWAIPVVIGAYIVLNQHHHDSSPGYPDYQNPGVVSQYPGSRGSAPGGYPPYGGNSGGRQPFPATAGSGQFNQPQPDGRQSLPTATGARHPIAGAVAGGAIVAGAVAARHAGFPGTAGRPGGPVASGRSPVSRQHPGFPQSVAKSAGAIGVATHAGGGHPAFPPRSLTSTVPVRHPSVPTARTVARVQPQAVRRPFAPRSVAVSPRTRPTVAPGRFPSPARRPIAMQRAVPPVPRASMHRATPIVHRAAPVVSRPRIPAARRTALPYGGSTIRRAAPVPRQRAAFPSTSRPQARRVPVSVRAAPISRPAPRSARPAARPAAPVSRPAPPPHPGPARAIPAPTGPR